MNPIPAAHVHDEIHHNGSPGAETFLPSTQTFLRKLADGAREGPPAQWLDGANDDIGHYRTRSKSNGSSNSSNSIKRKPVSRPASSRYSGARYSQLNPDVGPPTPGADDGEAVRFALDQLTRDEEVKNASRHYPGGRYSEQVPEQTSLLDGNHEYDEPMHHEPAIATVQPPYTYVPPPANYATVERSIPMTTESLRQTNKATVQPPYAYDPPIAGYAVGERSIPTTTEPLRPTNKIPPVAPAVVTAPAPVVPLSSSVPVTRAPPVQRSAFVERTAPAQTVKPMRPITPETALPVTPETFIEYDPNDNSLRALPKILNPIFLGLYILLVLAMLAALCFAGAWSSTHSGLWGYNQFGGARWFVFKYLPTICCMIMLIWLFQIQIAVQRITPFIAYASHNLKSRTAAPMMEVQPTQFLLPKLFYFGAGQPIVGVFMFIAWLHIFTPPLFASLFNVYFYGPIGLGGPGNWIWAAVQGIVWTLVGLYFILLVAVILLALWLWRQRANPGTGVKWDPRSLASLVAILDRSNAAVHYNGSESWQSNKMFRERLSHRTDKLGYWYTSRRQNDFFYALGDNGAEAPRGFHEGPRSPRLGNEKFSLDQDRNRHSYEGVNGGMHTGAVQTTASPIITNLDKRDDLYTARYRYLPWFLKAPILIALSAIVIILYLAYLIVSYVKQAVLHGFHTPFFIAPDVNAFSATNFFFAFMPALIAQFFFLCWLSIDYAFRRLQPYANMSDRRGEGATASRSLFLDYPYRLPFSCTLAAIMHGDFIVAWFSLVSLCAAALPVLGGGTFMSQFYIASQETRVSVDPEGYYALNAITAIYAFSLPLAILAARKRRLPHAVTTLGEQFSWLYASRLLGEREWRAQAASKADLHTRLLAPITQRERQLKGGEGRFAFGRFIGTDGQPHLGIDRVGRGEGTRMADRNFRQSGDRLLRTGSGPATGVNTVSGTPYGELESVQEKSLLDDNTRRAPVIPVVPPMPQHPATIERIPEPEPAPAPPRVSNVAAVPVESGLSPIARSHPTIMSSTTVETAPGFYDPYAKPELTGPAGFPVARELATVVAPLNAPTAPGTVADVHGLQLHREVVAVEGVGRHAGDAVPLVPGTGSTLR